MLIATAREMAGLDRETIERIGIPGIVLMENAGRGASSFFLERFPDLLKKRIAIVAGSGNNAGDGFVLARLFWNKGAMVRVVCLRSPERLHGDALSNFRIVENLGIPVTVWDETRDFSEQWEVVRESEAIVDAILGTGLNSEVKGLYRCVIDAINELAAPVLAVDISSGLDASTGKPLGTAIRAAATATFGLAKIGCLTSPGYEYTGALRVIDIGIPLSVVNAAQIKRYWLDHPSVSEWLAPRDPQTHKGRAGHAVVLAGSTGKTGAASLICHGAARAGAGLVTLMIPSSLNPILEVKLTETMTCPIAETEDHTPAEAALPQILEFLSGKQVLALGPGISLHPETQALVRKLVRNVACPMVLDADALTALAAQPDLLEGISAPAILTPHPGEMARLIRRTAREVVDNRLEIAAEFSKNFGVVLVIKGPRTVIAAPDGRFAINSTGNPAMASGGMGDALTGLIAGFVAQGYEAFQAACIGVYVHGAAADCAMGGVASRGLMASDLLDEIPRVVGRLEGFQCEC